MGAFPPELATVTTDINVDGRWWVRVRALTTADAARAQVILPLLAALVASPKGGRAERADALRESMSPADLAKLDATVNVILCECVEAGSLDGESYEPMRLVSHRRAHDPDASPPSIWAGRIPGHMRGAIVSAALLHHAEAEGILRPFRRESRTAPLAPQDSEDLRADAARGGDATP